MKLPAFLARWLLGRRASRVTPELETLVGKAELCIVDLDNHIRGAELTVRRLQSLKKQKGVAKDAIGGTKNGEPRQLELPGTDEGPEPSPTASPQYQNPRQWRKIELYRKAGF